MRSTHSLTVISLGGGVQSSVMALMASGGAFGQLPDCAIFADTHWEPPTIYPHLDWLAERLAFPLYIVDNGRSLREDAKALTNHSGNRGFIDLPLYLKGPARAGVRNGQGDGMGRRQCTEHYKIRPVRRKIRELLGLSRGQRVPAETTVELWLGISTDEAIRMKTSRDPVDTQSLPTDRGWDVQKRLPGVVADSLRPVAGALGLHRLPLPVPPEVGRDEAPLALSRIHRRRASGQCPEAARGCSCESGIMVLKQQSRPQNKEHPIDATTQPSRSHPNRV